MDDSIGSRWVQHLRKKCNRQLLLGHILRSVAITILTTCILFKFIGSTYALVAALGLILFTLLSLILKEKITALDVTKFLNEANPELEESAQLLLKLPVSLNTLEKLQLAKLETRLPGKPVIPSSVRTKLKSASFLLAFAVLAAITILIIPVSQFNFTSRQGNAGSVGIKPSESKPAGVAGITVTIRPPAYTRKTARVQQKWNIIAEQGAGLTWTISTTSTIPLLQLVFNDGSMLQLRATNQSGTNWTGTKVLKRAGFYQVKTGNNLSELYQVEMIGDQQPRIVVQSPEPNTLIEYGRPPKIQIDALVSDDYGIETAIINATTASGSGEAVKFKEQQMSFPGFTPGNKKYRLQKEVDLPSLGMQPGDELYLYLSVRDSYHQEKRSEVYIVRLEDTTRLMNLDGLVTPADVKPEFFRSQRQIIIETEQLIRDRDTISVESFNKKSAGLGIDQKLLRLRYGKFLGEESDAEPEEGGHDDDHKNTSPANAGHIIDQYSHRHDNAEDATFFDARTKKQLLATLSEMWKAELQLRTLNPKEALPFEYKALRLLKELQQSTRVYVAKTGTATTPLKPELRLTGDLAKIGEPVTQQDYRPPSDQITTLRKALGILEQVRSGEALHRPALEVLQAAGVQLSAKAGARPSAYLASLRALRRILKNKVSPADIDLAGDGLHKIIQQVYSLPQKSKAATDLNLSKRYFLNLQRKYE